MKKASLYQFLTYAIATVWLLNGLFCKILNLVPRHQQIVAQILGETYAPVLTVLIGLCELVMAAWVLTRFQSRLSAVLQIVVVITMNILEFVLVPDLLLWGHWNAVFALLFVSVVYYHEFVLSKQLSSAT